MSGSEHSHLAPAVSATDLLVYNETQLVEFLEKNAHPKSQGGFDVTGFDGLQHLPRDQRIKLAGRICAVLEQIEKRKLSQPIEANDLFTRLRTLADADEQVGSQSRNRRLSQSSISTMSTRICQGTEHERWQNEQEVVHLELIANGGRPTCSVEHLSHLITTPTADHEAVAPWLSNYPNSQTGEWDVYFVLKKQLECWSAFRKSQQHNRGLGDFEEGIEAFVQSQIRITSAWTGFPMRSKRFNRTLEERYRGQWKDMPVQRELPDQGFAAYSAAVKRRLAPYRFTHPIQLMEDPRQQTKWTDWLEYLNYEQWCLEELSATVQPLERKYHNTTTEIFELIEENREKYLGERSVNNIDPSEDLSKIRVALETTNKSIHDLIRQTALYTLASRKVFSSQRRLNWIVKEARVMESEMAQNDTRTGPSRSNENKKRRRNDEFQEVSVKTPRQKR
ncbi:hypothetical protein F4860DRAFT_39014 [Xylaria cubensis]|nr:hypothetical protein F4860DRAFT_39014 [Xylaria cubensis]